MATIWPRVASATQWPHLFLSVGLEGLLLAAVVVGHGDDREDHVDQVERAEEDDQHEEDHLVLAVRLDRLAGTTATTAHTQHAVSEAVWRLGMRLETVKCTSVCPSVCLSACLVGRQEQRRAPGLLLSSGAGSRYRSTVAGAATRGRRKFWPDCTEVQHTCNFSGTTRVSRYQKGKTNLDFSEARDSEWQWHQLGHIQVCTSLQTDNHASTPPLSFVQAGCPSCRPTNSVKALKAICRSVDNLLQQLPVEISDTPC